MLDTLSTFGYLVAALPQLRKCSTARHQEEGGGYSIEDGVSVGFSPLFPLPRLGVTSEFLFTRLSSQRGGKLGETENRRTALLHFPLLFSPISPISALSSFM